MSALLKLASGSLFRGVSFGAPLRSVAGEVVFTTSMVGYCESMTDPSYKDQILVFTQPLIGNYGVPRKTLDSFCLPAHFESNKIHVKAIVTNNYSTHYSHWNAVESLANWCKSNGTLALTGVDTRALVTELRTNGSMTGFIGPKSNPVSTPLVPSVSTKARVIYNLGGDVKIALIDMGVKNSIIRCLASLNAEVHLVPWNHDILSDSVIYDGIFISNGPGDPRDCTETIDLVKRALCLSHPVPIFGICMGNQILGLAAGFDLHKMRFGNRGHNIPVTDLDTGRCMITAQNHGYALSTTPPSNDWTLWFQNANDMSNEGIKHKSLPFASVQFHPEARGGPLDARYLFSDFITTVKKFKL